MSSPKIENWSEYKAWTQKQRDKAVLKLYRLRKDPAEIATITGLLEGQVLKILRRYLPTVNRREP